MKSLFILTILSVVIFGCKQDPVTILGCTDPNAINYNPAANASDNSCALPDTVSFTLDAVVTVDAGPDHNSPLTILELYNLDDLGTMIESVSTSSYLTPVNFSSQIENHSKYKLILRKPDMNLMTYIDFEINEVSGNYVAHEILEYTPYSAGHIKVVKVPSGFRVQIIV